MKSKSSLAHILCLALPLAFTSLDLITYAQQEMARARADKNEFILSMPKVSLKQTINDTILPTLCNAGEGLLHYESFSAKDEEHDYNYNTTVDKYSTAIRDEGYTESEFKILKEQQRLMQQQYNYELQQQMRKEKMDIGLGEIIKGFYLKQPPE